MPLLFGITMTIPNILAIIRFLGALTLPFIYGEISDTTFAIIAGCLAFSDMLDGFIARHFKQKSQFGIFFDPIADRTLAAMIFLTFIIYDICPYYLLLISLTREMLSIPTVIIARWKRLYYAPNAGVAGKINTNLQFFSFLLMFLQPKATVTLVFVILTGLSGILSAIIYAKRTGLQRLLIYENKSIKVENQKRRKKLKRVK